MSESTELHLPGAPAPPHSAVVTLGTFDGVHLGHRAVIDQAIAVGATESRVSTVLTFDPHPLRVVRPDAAPQLLTTTAEKMAVLRQTGADRVDVIPFTAYLARFSPRRFVEDVLMAHFGLAHLVVGHDHGFGKDRSGDVGTLRRIGNELGFPVTSVPPLVVGNAPVSSTRIRNLLLEGEVAAAADLLGRPYSMEGPVVRGEQRGRVLGFPTANVAVDTDKLLPQEGIYVVQVDLEGHAAPRQGVMHLGPRPTFFGFSASAEVYLLDFEENLYDRDLRVHFLHRIRGIARFDSAEALQDAIRSDIEIARGWFR